MKNKSVSINEIIEHFSLEVISGGEGIGRDISVSEIKRPGIELAGFWEHFTPDRVQLLGMTEVSFLKGLDRDLRAKRIRKFMNYDLRCVIVTRDLEIPAIIKKEAKNNNVPLLRTPMVTTRFLSKLTTYLERTLAPEKNVHGVLVDIYGVGVLIRGQSGIGKSETALELVKRGHRLVADDIINVKKIGEGELIGMAPEKLRYFLELRGIGIINVRTLFGAGAIKNNSPIEILVTMEPWDENKSYERLGMDNNYVDFLDVKVPEIVIPVKPGRNLAMVLEVAAMNARMKTMGYNAARDFISRTAPEE
ncbi:MAG: HPr(Ser) kinase/phosphatase [bacterium]